MAHNRNGNPKAGQEGQMVEEQRLEFKHGLEISKKGKDILLKETIANELEHSLNVVVPSKDYSGLWPHSVWPT